jgi:hypothetical protein
MLASRIDDIKGGDCNVYKTCGIGLGSAFILFEINKIECWKWRLDDKIE